MQDPALFELRVEPRRPNGTARPDVRQSLPGPNGKPGIVSVKRFAHYLVRPFQRLVPLAFTSAILAALYFGWQNSDEGHLTAESGVGYWLGIAGGSMMLFMLIYPMRKRIRILRYLGTVPSWFRVHMVLGILGPTLILFHTNFRLGSLNSNVALAAMLSVVASGVVGRYLYTKVHQGLFGRTAEVKEILADTEALKQTLGDGLTDASGILDELRAFETKALAPHRNFMSSLWRFFTLGFLIRRTRDRLIRHANGVIALEARRHAWGWIQKRRRSRAVRIHLTLYFAAVRKAARFAVFERLLALWHVLHMPLFVLLVITAIIHVVAVHQY